jgi:hypothetical protein
MNQLATRLGKHALTSQTGLNSVDPKPLSVDLAGDSTARLLTLLTD